MFFVFCSQVLAERFVRFVRLIRECWTSIVSWDASRWPKWKDFPKTSSLWAGAFENPFWYWRGRHPSVRLIRRRYFTLLCLPCELSPHVPLRICLTKHICRAQVPQATLGCYSPFGFKELQSLHWQHRRGLLRHCFISHEVDVCSVSTTVCLRCSNTFFRSFPSSTETNTGYWWNMSVCRRKMDLRATLIGSECALEILDTSKNACGLPLKRGRGLGGS